jgi:hypothetical protein
MGRPSGIGWGVGLVGIVIAIGGCGGEATGTTSSSGGTGGDGTTSSSGGTGGDGTTASSGGSGGACVPVDDGNPCTADVCENGVATSKPTPAGSVCSIGGTECDGAGACVAAACTGTLAFTAAASPSAGKGPISVTAADVDADGKTDLVVANWIGSNVSVLLNLGNGVFAAPVNYATGGAPSAIAALDLNGDGKPDLAVANGSLAGDGGTSVLLNLGNGTFAPQVSYGADKGSTSIAAADLNGDGKPDLVVANQGGPTPNDVSVLLNLGGGAFAPPVNYGLGGGAGSVAIADLNGDGKPDLAVAKRNSDNVRVFLGVGNGTFAPPTEFAAGQGPLSVAVRDLNGDGKPDLAFANFDGGDVSVLLGLGNGAFAPPASYAVGAQTQEVTMIAAADLNGDGKPDLAVAINSGGANGNVSVLLNLGNGTFGAAIAHAAHQGTGSVAVADLNADGRLDLVATNLIESNVSVLLASCLP